MPDETNTPRTERKRPPRTTRPPRVTEATVETEVPKESAPKKRPPTDRRIADSITGTYQSAGMVIIAAAMARQDEGLLGTGQAVVNGAESASEAWLELADQNPKVKKALQRFSEGSAVATLFAVHIGMVLPLAASRGVLPPMFGAATAAAAAGGGMPMPPSMNGNGE